MKSVFRILPAAGLLLGLALAGQPAAAQQQQQAPALKQGTPACMAAASEILQMKNAAAMYANAVPNIVAADQGPAALDQPQLSEGSQRGCRRSSPRSWPASEKEIGEGMAQIYCNEFTEQELKDLVAFYKSPLGQKLLTSEPRAIQFSMSYMNGWAQNFAETVNGEFRAEMRKRGKQI